MEPFSDSKPVVRKTYKYKLKPTPDQARTLEMVLWRCRTLYNTALEQRKTAWERCGVSLSYYQQAVELPDLKVACSEYAQVHFHVLQDVLRRVETTYQAFFRRLANGEISGYPRFQGSNRYHSFTYPQYSNGAVLDGGVLSLSKIGRIPVRLHRPLEGTPKTVTLSREADGWYACIACAEVPIQPLHQVGRETGIDVGLKVFLVTASGEVVENPRHYRKAEQGIRRAQRRISRRKPGSKRRRKAVALLRRKQQKVHRQRRDFHHKTALALLRAYDTLYCEAIQPANLSWHPNPMGTAVICTTGRKPSLASTKAFTTPDGANSSASSPVRQHGPASEWTRCHRRIRRRTVAAVGSVCPNP